MGFTKEIIETKPREVSGSKTSAAYDYQKNWSIKKLLELHQGADSYTLCFEHHDDLVVYNETVEEVYFYQIKKLSNKRWTTASLTSKKNGSSILGKMYQNRINFPNLKNVLFFVSNAEYSLENIHRDIELTSLRKHEPKTFSKIRESLKDEHSKEKVDLSKISLINSGINFENSSNEIRGELVSFFKDNSMDVTTLEHFYVSLFDHVKALTANEVNPSHDEDVFLNSKTISRDDFEKMIQQAISCAIENKNYKHVGEMILQRLVVKGAGFEKIQRIRNKMTELEVKMTRNDPVFMRIYQIVKDSVKVHLHEHDDEVLCKAVFNDCKQNDLYIEYEDLFDEDLIETIITYIILSGNE